MENVMKLKRMLANHGLTIRHERATYELDTFVVVYVIDALTNEVIVETVEQIQGVYGMHTYDFILEDRCRFLYEIGVDEIISYKNKN